MRRGLWAEDEALDAASSQIALRVLDSMLLVTLLIGADVGKGKLAYSG